MSLRHSLLAAVAAAHVVVVASVVSQPLDGNVPPTAPRSVSWRLHLDSVMWPGPGVDFFALYHAGVQVRQGRSPYDASEIPQVTPYYFRFLYSPALAYAAGVPLSLLPPAWAYRLWVALVEASLVIFLLAWRRSCVADGARWLGTVVLLLSAPYFLELHAGQFTFAAAALGTGSLLATSAGRSRMLAAALAFSATLLKIYPACGLPALLHQRSARWPLTGTILALTAMGLTALAIPRDGATLAALHLTDDTARPHPGHIGLLHVVRLALLAAGIDVGPDLWSVLAPATLGMAMLATVAAVWRCRMSALPGYALLLLAFLLFYSRTAEHHYSAVLLLSVVLFGDLCNRGLARAERVMLGACLLAIAAPTLYGLLPEDPARWSTAATLALPLAKAGPALIVFAVALARCEPRQRPGP